jgi:predicted ATPase
MGLHGVTGLGLRSWEAVKLAVSKGIGIAAISRLALDLELEAGRIVILDVPRWRLQRTISVVRPRDVPLTPPAGRFLQLLRETFIAEQPPPNSNLPTLETALVGRGRELAELSELVRAGALVTLTGPGGSGKTRLAIEVARGLVDDFPDGVFLVDLAPLRDPDLVLSAIADVLALKNTEDLDQRLQGHRLLLVVDNFEHLVDAASAVARLATSARVGLLATSRVPLGIRGESKYRVEPLPLDDATALFLERAREVNPRFGDGTPVRRICQRLDRLPLALELAAARARGTTAARLADRLEARVPLLAGRRDSPRRQRTLTAAIAWSYDLLDESQQALLARLAVFRGGWSGNADEKVCGADDGDVLALTDANLIRADDERFSMLETVREFAHDRLVENGELDDVRGRHAEHMLAVAQKARPLARGPDEQTILRTLTLELDNFRAAFAYALEKKDAALGLTLGEALEPLWIRGMRQREAVRQLEPLLRLDGNVDVAIRAGAFTIAGRSAIEAGDITKAEPWLREGLELARNSGDEHLTAWAAHGVGHLVAEQGNMHEAKDLFEESMQLFLRLGEHAPAGGRMTYLAYYAAREGDLDGARSLLEQAVEQYRLAGDAAGVGGCLNSLGDIALEQHDLRTALRHYRAAEPLLVRSGTPIDLVVVLGAIAALAAQSGRREVASTLWGALERIDAESDRKLDADDRARYERAVGELDSRQVEAGRALSNDEAVALARNTADELATEHGRSPTSDAATGKAGAVDAVVVRRPRRD